jgi:hypothetical protein
MKEVPYKEVLIEDIGARVEYKVLLDGHVDQLTSRDLVADNVSRECRVFLSYVGARVFKAA